MTDITSQDLNRQENESIYDYEDRVLRVLCGSNICGNRTMHGTPWAMPCTLESGHNGECSFLCPDGFGFIIERVS